jgi:hypothetical protein
LPKTFRYIPYYATIQYLFPTLQIDSQAICDMLDVAGFYINVFGGEQFVDYVSLTTVAIESGV